MPIVCSAGGCTNRFIKGSEIRFYRFPISKPQLAEQWVRSLNRKNFVPTTNSCLCSEHFQPDCFRDYNGKPFLREEAIPTIFNSNKQSKVCTHQLSNIELRRNRGQPGEVNRLGLTQDKPRLRIQEKRQSSRDARGRMLDKKERRRGKMAERQTMTGKSKVYDSRGLLISCGRDLCDCLDADCMGCFYPCPDCGSRKCGVECRCDRKWLYEQVEVEGGEIIRNKFAS
ncbi:ARL14 effector protein isoform X1 [Alosa sapidissima]|uniref:ARL14 effector protein isoform X1 n=1 Tax=Alosa sapidissima TaxID=34773 RepID=UPI001C099EC8|nr:ARL14 effector protein isoform X1 [Alosa sapidissima]